MKLRYERATKTIRTVPNNNWVCTVDSWDAAINPESIAIAMCEAFNTCGIAPNFTRIGTCNFVSLESVIKYYAKQGIDSTEATMKVACNEVLIGVPHLNGNESVELDNDGRFFIVTK